MQTGATLVGVAAIIAASGYIGIQAFDRYEQHQALRVNLERQTMLEEQNTFLHDQLQALRDVAPRLDACLKDNEKLKAASGNQ
jgi:hypothetical protein